MSKWMILLLVPMVLGWAHHQMQTTMRSEQSLFGENGWDAKSWVSVNDRVRGGRSTSALTCRHSTSHFTGHLDTTALGGAGFASMRYSFTRPMDLSAYSGIRIHVLKGDGKDYALNLYSKPVQNDGQSRVEYKVFFKGSKGLYSFAWSDFVAYYRGRPTEADPLDHNQLYSLSLMLQSQFGKQSGDYSLYLTRISAYN